MTLPAPRITLALAAAVLLVLTACGPAPAPRGINDPYEEQNRAVHEANKAIDRAIFRPLSATGSREPNAVMRGVTNFSNNLALPGDIVNDLLQANIDDAAHNFARLIFNTTFGIGGIFDPSTSWGLRHRPSDFGETLHVWGATEGHYVELPFAGPSTKRDAIGKLVDAVINPLNYVIPSPERVVVPIAGAISRASSRSRFGDSVDSILYDSADSYAQTRLLYLENRRFQLGQQADVDVIDPFEVNTEGF